MLHNNICANFSLTYFFFFSPNKNSHKRILLFTNNDNPNSSDPSQQVSRVCQYNLIIMELTSLAHCYTQFIFPLYITMYIPITITILQTHVP